MRSFITFLLIFCAAWGHAQFEKAEARVRQALANDKPFQVISLSERALTKKGAPPIFHVLRADGYIQVGKYAQARYELDQARTVLGNTPEFRSQLLGIYSGQGKLDSAMLYMDPPEALVGNAEHLYRAGNVFLRAGDVAQAMRYFDLGVHTYPRMARMVRERGASHALLGDSVQARADLDKAVELAPREAASYNSRAYYGYLHFGDPARAMADLDKAIKQDPNYGYAFSNRGWCAYKLGDVAKARKDLALAIRKNPGNAYAYRSLGIIAIETGDKAKGCAELHQALEQGFTGLYGNEVLELIAIHCANAAPAPVVPLVTPPKAPPANAPGAPPPNKTNAP
jgi:tetratricopeptide (TPR) repeat protein